jgi:acyl-CoA synthetase (AMP-forming)/AMP-acid ligase II
LRLIDNNGNPAGPEEEGEIQIQSDALMAGYWNDPEATAAAMDDGWFCTGDLGRCDETGYYRFVGRSKEIIVCGGSNISPLEVEEVLLRHPAVQEVAVVGKPDPVLAETVAAFVVLKFGQTLSVEELLKFTESQLALFKQPRTVIFLADLPRSATGKIKRKALKDSFTGTETGI